MASTLYVLAAMVMMPQFGGAKQHSPARNSAGLESRRQMAVGVAVGWGRLARASLTGLSLTVVPKTRAGFADFRPLVTLAMRRTRLSSRHAWRPRTKEYLPTANSGPSRDRMQILLSLISRRAVRLSPAADLSSCLILLPEL